MNYFKIQRLIFCVLISISTVNAKDCFIVSEHNHIIHEQGECSERMSPCSTFKIAISLMGFDSGILIDEMHPTWDFKPGYIDWLDVWNQSHNPKSWFANSCVWYSQIITTKLGMDRFRQYLNNFDYGNHDISGDEGVNNGLTHSWLSSSLAISPKEQIEFMNKLIVNQLPVSIDAQVNTKNLMYQETLLDGWMLYGKTGNGSQLDANGNKIQDRQVGWFVGFVRKGEKSITFAYLIVDEDKQDTYASLRAKATLKDRIRPILIDMGNDS